MGIADSATELILATLKRSRLFQVAPTADLERLAPRCMLQRYRRGADIVRRSTPGESLVVVGRGRIKATVPSPAADGEFLIEMFWPGDAFGELSLFDRLSRPITATAVSESEVVFVPRTDVMALLERRPTVSIRMIESLCERLRASIELNLSLRFLDLPCRFYQRLAYLSRFDSRAEGTAVRINHGLSQQELADSIGASREGLNKLIAEWKRSGLIDSGRGFVVVRDVAALTQRVPMPARQEFQIDFLDGVPIENPVRPRPSLVDE